MSRQVHRLRMHLGRVVRDIERNTDGREDRGVVFAEELAMAQRLLVLGKQDRNKLHSLHAPEVECISKGKAHKRYEIGVKVSIATTNRRGFVLGGMTLSGNPYGGHTLNPVIGHLKSDGHLGRNWLKDVVGDRMNVLLCCAGHNLQLNLRRLRFFCLWILGLGCGVHGIRDIRQCPGWSGRW